MNDPLNDPLLQSLEARLASHPPKLADAERTALLYKCAFSAGQQVSRRAARPWQIASGVLAMALVATALVPLTQGRTDVAKSAPSPKAPTVAAAQPDRAPQVEVAARPNVTLDAWQPEGNTDAELAQALDRFRDLDTHLRSLAVTSLAEQLAHDR